MAIREQVRASKQILDAETPQHGQATSALLTTEKSQAASLKARDNSLAEEHKQLTNQLKAAERPRVKVSWN